MKTYQTLHETLLLIKSDKVRQIATQGLERMHERISNTKAITTHGMDSLAAVYAIMWLHASMTEDIEGLEAVTVLFMAHRRKFAPTYVLRHYIDMLESGYSPEEVQAVPPMQSLPSNLPTEVLEELVRWKQGLKYVSDSKVHERIMIAFAKYIHELEIFWQQHLTGKVSTATVLANADNLFVAKSASDYVLKTQAP